MDGETAKKSENTVKIKKSKKPTRCYDLMDFVVIKKKSQKTQKLVTKKISSKSPKKGKVRRKKPTTLKKKVLRERYAKLCSQVNHMETVQEEDEQLEDIQEIVAKIEDIKIDDNCDVKDNIQDVQHSRNFRDYCDHFITQEIKQYSEIVIKDLFRYQENKFQQNPVKAKAHKRYVVGFKEVKKFLVVERLKLLFIAPDLEKNAEIDNLVSEIKQLAQRHKTPYTFGIKRRKLGFLLLKKVPVSIVGIFDYQGTAENVNILLDHVAKERNSYKNKTRQN